MADFRTKYSIGEFAVAIAKASLPRFVNCSICNEDKLVLINGTYFRCPSCRGTGRHAQKSKRQWVVYTIGRVTKIFIEAQESRVEVIFKLESHTRLWPGHHLFETKEIAQKICDQLNAKDNED